MLELSTSKDELEVEVEVESNLPIGEDQARILCVDDSVNYLYSLKRQFNRKNYEVVYEPFASRLMNDKYNINLSYDLALIDMFMPEVSGLQLLRYLRKCRPFSPVVVLTGALENTEEYDSLVDKCYRYGATSVMNKSSGIQHLSTVVECLVGVAAQQLKKIEDARRIYGV